MTHDLIDARSLESHRLVADRIEHDPGLCRLALKNIERWLDNSPSASPYLMKWRSLLLGDVAALLTVIRSESEEATALRQCTPFAGEPFISQTERLQLIRKYAALAA